MDLSTDEGLGDQFPVAEFVLPAGTHQAAAFDAFQEFPNLHQPLMHRPASICVADLLLTRQGFRSERFGREN